MIYNDIMKEENSSLLILIGIIIIFVLLILHYNYDYEYEKDKNENFDARISNITLTECGTECTQALNCVGFAYDNANSKCYLSKSSIISQPHESLYDDEYK